MAEKGDEGKKKRGRPKGQPLSEKELAQRRAAPHKHGEFAATALGQGLPACKPSTCPLETPPGGGYPCNLKKDVERRGGALSACLVSLGDERHAEAFRKALEGDPSDLRQLTALTLGAKSSLEHSELVKLLEEGLTIQFPIVGMGANGPEILDYRVVENPRAPILLKLSEQLGRTASEQVVTPKARGEKGANDGIAKVAHLVWMKAMQRGLSGAGEGD